MSLDKEVRQGELSRLPSADLQPGKDEKLFSLTGVLTKLGNKVRNWLDRGFALDRHNGKLLYFRSAIEFQEYASDPSANAKQVAGAIPLQGARVFVAYYAPPNHCVELTACSGKQVRHYYLHAKSRESILRWLGALTRAGVTYVSPLPRAQELKYVSKEAPQPVFGMQGFLEKRGFYNKGFKLRFFRIDQHSDSGSDNVKYCLSYCKQMDDVKPKGTIMLMDSQIDCNYIDAASSGYREDCVFAVKTPKRDFILRAPSSKEKEIWVSVLQHFVGRDGQAWPEVPEVPADDEEGKGEAERVQMLDDSADESDSDDGLGSATPAESGPVPDERRGAEQVAVKVEPEEVVEDPGAPAASYRDSFSVKSSQGLARRDEMLFALRGDDGEAESPVAEHSEARTGMLTAGAHFLKHGRRGRPHRKHVFVAGQRVFWAASSLNKRRKSLAKCIGLVEAEILEGKQTAVFARDKNVDSSQCFSIKTQDRTLDLQCDSKRTRDEWVAALRSHMRTLVNTT